MVRRLHLCSPSLLFRALLCGTRAFASTLGTCPRRVQRAPVHALAQRRAHYRFIKMSGMLWTFHVTHTRTKAHASESSPVRQRICEPPEHRWSIQARDQVETNFDQSTLFSYKVLTQATLIAVATTSEFRVQNALPSKQKRRTLVIPYRMKGSHAGPIECCFVDGYKLRTTCVSNVTDSLNLHIQGTFGVRLLTGHPETTINFSSSSVRRCKSGSPLVTLKYTDQKHDECVMCARCM